MPEKETLEYYRRRQLQRAKSESNTRKQLNSNSNFDTKLSIGPSKNKDIFSQERSKNENVKPIENFAALKSFLLN